MLLSQTFSKTRRSNHAHIRWKHAGIISCFFDIRPITCQSTSYVAQVGQKVLRSHQSFCFNLCGKGSRLIAVSQKFHFWTRNLLIKTFNTTLHFSSQGENFFQREHCWLRLLVTKSLWTTNRTPDSAVEESAIALNIYSWIILNSTAVEAISKMRHFFYI